MLTLDDNISYLFRPPAGSRKDCANNRTRNKILF